MLSFSHMEQSLSLRDAKKYVAHSLDTLAFFVENVELKESFNMSFDYELCSNAFNTANKNFGCKVIRPLKKLCLRLIDKGMGLSQVHLTFIKIILKNQCYPEAMQVMEKKALPSSLSILEYFQYLYFCGRIYILLKRYEEANECFHRIVTGALRGLKDGTFFVLALKLNIIFNEILGKSNMTREDIRRIFEELKLSNPLFDEWDINYEGQFQIYSMICERKELKTAEQFAILQKDKITDFYRMINYSAVDLRRKIAAEIRAKNQRIKTKEIAGHNLQNLSTMEEINKCKPLARYDQQNKILYFNHNPITEKNVNSSISRCYEMYSIVSAERDMEEKGRGMGGMGGIGALMSMFGGRF